MKIKIQVFVLAKVNIAAHLRLADQLVILELPRQIYTTLLYAVNPLLIFGEVLKIKSENKHLVKHA